MALPRWQQHVVMTASLLGIAVGLLVIVGSSTAPFPYLPFRGPLHVKGGLCLVLLGIALLCNRFGRNGLGAISGGLACATGVLMAVQWGFETEWGAGRLFRGNAASPGRISASSALAFVALGLVFVGIPFIRRVQPLRFVLAVLACVGTALAVTPSIGYLTGFAEAFGSGSSAPIALLESIAAVIVGASCLMWLYEGPATNRIGSVSLLPVFVAIAGLTASFILHETIVADENWTTHQNINDDTDRIQSAMERGINTRINRLATVAEKWRTEPTVDVGELKLDAALSYDETLLTILWLGPHYRIRFALPQEPEQWTTGNSLANVPEIVAAGHEAALQNQPRNTNLLGMNGGQEAIAVLVPMGSRGFIAGVFLLQALLDATVWTHVANDYWVTITANGQPILAGGQGHTNQWSVTRPIELPGQEWLIELSPKPSILAPLESGIARRVLIASLLLTAALAAAVHYAQVAHDRATAMSKLSKKLQRSNEDLQRFAYVASHDLREPLHIVASYVQLLGQEYKGKLDADADEMIHFAVDGVMHMEQLLSDLLAFSRVQTHGGKLTPTNATESLNRALADLKCSIDGAHAVVTSDPLPAVMAHHTQLVQLLQNMISNAIKFRGEQEPRVHVSAMRSGDYWTFSVKDNGIGIDPKHHERIFVIFKRLHTRQQYAGTGIGLAICKRIVERFGGKIWVQSEAGKGSTFYFTLKDAGSRGWQERASHA